MVPEPKVPGYAGPVSEPARELRFVRHEPNAASEGQMADLEIGEFLIRGVYGPEHLELLRLIGTLVEDH